MKKYVTCIVAAGGSGVRMGTAINKLFLEINEVPVIAYTLSALENCEMIDEIIISAKKEEIEYLKELTSKFLISKVKTIVEGGATRGESVLSAYRALSQKTEVVAVQDGARPLVTDEIIKETINYAIKFGASACGVKPKCTLKSVKDGYIKKTINREETIEIQTPQVFSKEIFDKMYSLDEEFIKSATDDCILAEKVGAKIYVTEGSYKNIKITTPDDIETAENFLRRY